MTCTSDTAKFEFNRDENVHISGITFQGCSSGAVIQMSTVTRTTITRKNFTQNEANCLQASYSMVTINESRVFLIMEKLTFIEATQAEQFQHPMQRC